MIKTFIAFFLLNMNGSKGFFFFDEYLITGLVVIGILIHLLFVVARYTKQFWLKVLSTLLYVPLLFVLILLSVFYLEVIVILIASTIFFYFTVVRIRK